MQVMADKNGMSVMISSIASKIPPLSPYVSATTMPEKILLVSPASPFAPQSGAQQRTALLHEALQTLGDVDVLLLEPTAGPSRLEPPKPGILAHGLWHQRPFGIWKFKPDPALNQALRAAGVDLGRYQLIVSRYLNPITKLAIPSAVRTVVDLDDWGYYYAPGTLALAARLKSAYGAWLAQRQLKRFDAFFFVSQRDQARHPDLQSALLPNIPFNPPAQPFPQTDSSTLLFVGSLWYAPNREGIDRFLAQCWPAIKAAQPQARLLLVGAAPPAVRQAWEQHPDVSAPGFVDDLGETYRDAAFTIAPIYSGGGTNIKILESLAYGRACVTTPHCASAFESDLASAGLGIAQDDACFAKLCVAWLADIDSRRSEAEKGHARIGKHYTRALFVDRVTQLSAPFLDHH
jgi:glycosyltransferase involved in cell wall biosynthesis